MTEIRQRIEQRPAGRFGFTQTVELCFDPLKRFCHSLIRMGVYNCLSGFHRFESSPVFLLEPQRLRSGTVCFLTVLHGLGPGGLEGINHFCRVIFIGT